MFLRNSSDLNAKRAFVLIQSPIRELKGVDREGVLGLQGNGKGGEGGGGLGRSTYATNHARTHAYTQTYTHKNMHAHVYTHRILWISNTHTLIRSTPMYTHIGLT